ncbi:MAG: hypothetical protein KKF85_12255, partial [Gammaproteobacteria bacterium]|nr:hypothetical protein [Gammaproteobacteria bacterium]MBU4003340.1 hypothetical protein [Gammaproteobacteria bacterium]MBU4022172.1 hypothetical protein [Gammaproteobacteria bacterium]MBU4096047.1 hypothetical protein [Gammaproteobacteria bacterium]MBU4147733.1 hypothetical protein [Gammaproteobacteria bacterium]
DKDSTSVFHQGQELTFHSKSGSMAAIFTCLTTSNEGLAKWGRPSMTNFDLFSTSFTVKRHARNPDQVFPA